MGLEMRDASRRNVSTMLKAVMMVKLYAGLLRRKVFLDFATRERVSG